jgi:hypothetical protein
MPSRVLFSELGPLGVTWEGTSNLKAIRLERYKLIVKYADTSKRVGAHERSVSRTTASGRLPSGP